MAEKNLEEKLFNIKDWTPLVGAIKLIFYRKIPIKYQESWKEAFYIAANGAYNYGLFELGRFLVKKLF